MSMVPSCRRRLVVEFYMLRKVKRTDGATADGIECDSGAAQQRQCGRLGDEAGAEGASCRLRGAWESEGGRVELVEPATTAAAAATATTTPGRARMTEGKQSLANRWGAMERA